MYYRCRYDGVNPPEFWQPDQNTVIEAMTEKISDTGHINGMPRKDVIALFLSDEIDSIITQGLSVRHVWQMCEDHCMAKCEEIAFRQFHNGEHYSEDFLD